MLLDKLVQHEKSVIAWGINVDNFERDMGYTTSFKSKAFTTATSYVSIDNNLGKIYNKKPFLCHVYQSELNPNVISVNCEIAVESKPQNDKLELIDIGDIIKEITATDEGKIQWKEAQDSVNSELWKKVANGRMSKIKYYRMVKGLTQKELADKADMHQPDVARIEKLGYRGYIPTYKKLAEILDTDYRNLMP